MAGRSDIMAGRAFVTLGLNNSDFVKGLRNASKRLKDFGHGMAVTGAAITGAGLAMNGMLSAALGQFASTGEELAMMSRRTGIAASALSEMSYAAQQSGTDLEGFEVGLRKMQKFLEGAAEGTKENTEALARLGLTYGQLAGLSPDQQFQKMADALAGIQDPTRRAGMAMEVFGRSGTNLLPMIENLSALRKEMRDQGLGFSDRDIGLAEQVHHAFVLIKTAVDKVVFNVGGALAPAFNNLASGILSVVATVNQWVKTNQGLFVALASVATGLIAFGAAVTGIGFALRLAGSGLGIFLTGFKVVIGIIGAVLSPMGLLVAGLALAAAAWIAFTDSGKAFGAGFMKILGDVAATVKKTFGGIMDALSAGNFSLAGKIAMTGLKVGMIQILTGIGAHVQGVFGDMLGKIGAQIGGGDFAGAWGTAVAGMATIWAAFSDQVVGKFSTMAKSIISVWEAAVDWITNKLLELEPVLNTAIKILHPETLLLGEDHILTGGVDLQAEQARRKALNDKARAMGLPTESDNVVDEAQKFANQRTAAAAAGANAVVDAVKKAADDNMANAVSALQNRTKGGAAAGVDALAQAQQDLDDLVKQAAVEAKKARDDAQDKAAAIPDTTQLGGMKNSVVASFSTSASLAMARGGTSNPAAETAKNTKQALAIQQAAAKAVNKIADNLVSQLSLT